MKPVLLWSWPEHPGSLEALTRPQPAVHTHGGKLLLKTHGMEDLSLGAGAPGGPYYSLASACFPCQPGLLPKSPVPC